jgi:hypothetical protein
VVRFLALVSLLVAAVLLAAPARAPLPGAMSAPEWTVGDSWEYRFNTSFSDIVWFNGTVRTEIVGVENRTVRGVAQDAYVVDTTGSGAVDAQDVNGTWDLVGEQVITVRTRTVVRNLLRLDAEGTTGPFNLPFVIQWTNRTENLVVRNDWSYPVPLGFAGRVSFNASFDERVYVQFGTNGNWTNTTFETEVDFGVSLQRTDVVAVPAGSFETFVIAETGPDGSTERFDYAPAAGNNARTQAFNGSGREVARTELVSYRYRAAGAGGTIDLWIVAAGVLVAAAAAVAVAWLVTRQRRRERQYTPPSIRDPPTGGP